MNENQGALVAETSLYTGMKRDQLVQCFNMTYPFDEFDLCVCLETHCAHIHKDNGSQCTSQK